VPKLKFYKKTSSQAFGWSLLQGYFLIIIAH